ncbi:MAG TPA: hypothetical protein VKH41_11775, partial [Myxococcota bacterium]|nr:hypothetical protein [Myxococcota bacterium]
IGQALRQIALWLSAARDQHSRVGGDLDRLPPRLRAWTRTRLSHRTPADILARVLLTDDPECVSFDREQRDARACAVSFVLRQAGRSKGPPVGLYLARGARPMGRRILRALGPVLQLFRLMNAEQTVRRQLPPERRPQHALSPVPRPVKRWSHLLRAYLVTDDGDAY